MTTESSADYLTRFQGLQRLYGTDISAILANLHICVVGLGGVGSWAVESLARSGIGKITIIDYDEVALSNTNRQSHTTTTNIARKKYQVMQERIRDINPECTSIGIDDDLMKQAMALRQLKTEKAVIERELKSPMKSRKPEPDGSLPLLDDDCEFDSIVLFSLTYSFLYTISFYVSSA